MKKLLSRFDIFCRVLEIVNAQSIIPLLNIPLQWTLCLLQCRQQELTARVSLLRSLVPYKNTLLSLQTFVNGLLPAIVLCRAYIVKHCLEACKGLNADMGPSSTWRSVLSLSFGWLHAPNHLRRDFWFEFRRSPRASHVPYQPR